MNEINSKAGIDNDNSCNLSKVLSLLSDSTKKNDILKAAKALVIRLTCKAKVASQSLKIPVIRIDFISCFMQIYRCQVIRPS